MHLINVKKTTLICAISTVLAGPALAQIESKSSPFVRPAPNEAVIEKNIISSDVDKAVIPPSIYYGVIFREIQSAPPEVLTDADWKIIIDLPAHEDAQFRRIEVEGLNAACALATAAGNNSKILEAANAFDDTATRHRVALDAHYKNVLRTLTLKTQLYVETRLNELKESDAVGYASIRMKGIAEESPETARTMILKPCQVMAKRNVNVSNLESLKLSDDHAEIIPMNVK